MTTKQVATKKPVVKNKALAAKEAQSIKNERDAHNAVSASLMGAVVTQAFTKSVMGDIDLLELTSKLSEKTKAVQDGNMKAMEAMLVTQAQALQAIFTSLAYKASSQTNLSHYSAFLSMALKAQSQSRSTIQALTELKYPKQVSFVKQANITTGNQQVNNVTPDPSRVKEKTIQSNELLVKGNHGSEKMDGRTTQTTIPKNKAMETVVA